MSNILRIIIATFLYLNIAILSDVKDYKKSDESVMRSSEAVDSMETEYEKSRYKLVLTY